jgi:ABC-type antimicrobial peptide transport system permease subunit
MPIPFSYSLRSIAVRRASSAMAVGGIALVVIVFVALLALASGFRKAVASSGHPQNLIVMRKGAEAELQSQINRDAARIISELPLVAKDDKGAPLWTVESVIILSRKKRDGGDTNVTVRGVNERSTRVHQDFKITEGRFLTPGSDEAVIGAGLARRLEGFAVGQSLTAGRTHWRIVGVFESAGSVLESEMWIDSELMQSVFNRGNVFQSMLLRVEGDVGDARMRLRALVEDDPRLNSLQVDKESDYYRKQAELMAGVITALGGILTAIMSVGAVVGAMNTMYAAVSQRRREIGCMLAMGFSPESVWLAFILESLLLSSIGAVIGCAVSLIFNGIKTGTANWATFSETAFEFQITPQIALTATGLALFMGFIGGLLPAFHAARMKVVDALRRA